MNVGVGVLNVSPVAADQSCVQPRLDPGDDGGDADSVGPSGQRALQLQRLCSKQRPPEPGRSPDHQALLIAEGQLSLNTLLQCRPPALEVGIATFASSF